MNCSATTSESQTPPLKCMAARGISRPDCVRDGCVETRRLRTRRGAGQRGQAAVLIALGLFTLVVFTALATNLGILVNEKIRIQNTADLAAYSGAYQQGLRLNAIAGLNKAIQDTVLYCRDRLTGHQGRFGAVKIWNQCTRESIPPDMPEPPIQLMTQIGAAPPQHSLVPPRPFAGFGLPDESDQCLSDVDRRANQLIEWCANTINYYGQLVFDLNDYNVAYYGRNTMGINRAIRGYQRKGIFKAIERTAAANYPNAKVEMLDQPVLSPVYDGAFFQTGVDSVVIPDQGGGVLTSIASYNRPNYRATAMAPMIRYPTNFNYVFMCCRRNSSPPCGPPQCGFPGMIKGPYVGPVNDQVDPRVAYVQFNTIYSYNMSKGMLYMPVRVWADPNRHNVPVVDLPGKTADTNYFGGTFSWNMMRAVALAKPFEGFVGPAYETLEAVGINNETIPPIINIGSNVAGRPILNGVFTADPLEDLKVEGEEPYPDYRARMAGFREPLLSRYANPQYEDTKKIGKTMLDVLVQHTQIQSVPGDNLGDDYQNTSH